MENELEIIYKSCTQCNINKNITDFPKNGKVDKIGNIKYRNVCKSCFNNSNREYYKNNKNKYNKTRENWRNNNIEHLRNYVNITRKNKRSNDEVFKLKCRIRTLFWETFKKKNFVKKSKSLDMLQCSYEFFKEYIEAQFTIEMNWDNIHLDHIKPLSTANTIEEVIILNHYTNFQPLLAKDNLTKHNSLVEKQLRLL